MPEPRWAPNPFGRTTVAERPSTQRLPAPSPKEVPPPVKEEPSLPPIPPEGITQTFEGIELFIQEDFLVVGTERQLKSKDYIAFSEGKEVGRFSSETGEFTPRDISWWEKAGSVVLRGLEKATATFAEVGIERKALGQPWYLPTFKNTPASRLTAEAIKSRQIGGEEYEEYKKLSFFEQLKYEFPAWLALSLVPGATQTRAAAKVLPTALRVPVRAALAPIAAYEKVVATGLKYGIGIPLKGVSVGSRKTFEKALDLGLDKWLVRQGIRGDQANKVIQYFLKVNNRWLYKQAETSVKKRLAERLAAARAGTVGANDVVRAAEPMLKDALKSITGKELVPTAITPAMTNQLIGLGYAAEQISKMPLDIAQGIIEQGIKLPTPEAVRPPIDEFERRLTGEITKGQREITEAGAEPTVPEVSEVELDRVALADEFHTFRQEILNISVKGETITDTELTNLSKRTDIPGKDVYQAALISDGTKADISEKIKESVLREDKFARELVAKPPEAPTVPEVEGLELFHGTRAEFKDVDITTGKKMYGIHLTIDEGIAKDYGAVKKYTLVPNAKLLDLSDGDTLWEFMKKEGILDAEDIVNVDLERYVKDGQLFQYDISSKTSLADDVAKTAEDLGYDVIKMPDDLGGRGENVAYVVVNKDVLQVAKPTAVTKPPMDVARVNAIHEQGRVNPESVSPTDAKTAHIELAAPGGVKPPTPPTTPTGVEPREPSDIMKEIADKATRGERPDQTLLRLHEGAINAGANEANIIVTEGNEKLKAVGIGVTTRGQLVPLPKDISKLDELYNALHNPSKVASGEVTVPKGLEEIYQELRGLTDWEQSARLDFDPEMATVEDYFYRGWKPPDNAFANVVQGRPLVKTPSFKKPRVGATYQEMRDAGFEPISWNPYQQWKISRMQGVKYREQMELVSYLKGMGNEFIRPYDGGSIIKGWRTPEVGPAFEGKPFAIEDPVNGAPTVMYTRRWLVPDKIATAMENIYGKKLNLGKFTIAGKTIDPLTIIDAITFIPKRAKLFASLFQQVDFLTRAGAGDWSRFADEVLAGNPIEAIKAPARYPATAAKIIQSNFSPAKRLSLAKQLNSTTPLIEGRDGINLKGIVEAGLSTMDITIFPADMDKLIREMAKETGVIGTIKGMGRLIGDLESAMRRGLFNGVYPAAMITDIQNNIAPMIHRQFSSLNDAQINGEIARITNIKYSTIPASQSVIQNRVLRETLRRVFFSMGESEGLLRQAAGAIKGPHSAFWRKYFIGVYLFLITTASIIHFASTGEPLPKERYSPISKDSWGPLPFGYNTRFAAPDIPIKGRGGTRVTVDLVGQLDTALRLLDPVNFITSRESVPVRTLVNQISGTDFYGAPIDDIGPGGIISRTSQLMFDLFAPIGLGGLIPELRRIEGMPEGVIPQGEERLGLTGLAIQATGLNLRAETTMNLLNRFAQESGFLKADGTPVEEWADLEPFQKNDLSNNEMLQTELGLRSKAAVERQQLGALGFATLDDIDQERVVRGEALVSEFFADTQDKDRAEYSSLASAFRGEVTLLKREMSARKAQVDIDFGLFKETGKLPTDPNKKALVEFYNTYDLSKKPSGVIDWDKQERLENTLRAKWTGAQEAYVDRNIGLTEWGVMMAEYNKSTERLREYWEIPKGINQSKRRAAYRKLNPEVDAMLVLWYGYKPIGSTAITPVAPVQRQQAPTPTEGLGVNPFG